MIGLDEIGEAVDRQDEVEGVGVQEGQVLAGGDLELRRFG